MGKYICNPVNMNYPAKPAQGRLPGFARMSVPHNGTGDTTVVRFKGRYYMVGSIYGFWYSDDLVTWNYQTGDDLDIPFGAAADICQIGDWLYETCSSRETCTIYRTKDPMSREFEAVSSPMAYWDPCLFLDDDGRVYLYYGCSNRDPIWGVEMDPETMLTKGERMVLIEGDPDRHGWERNGWNNDPKVGMLRPGETDAPGLDYAAPWIEGPYMNKHDGRYYLQYAAPGTELPFYADGCYTSDKPLGPFVYCPNSPFSAKPSGYYTAAGHGSSFEDEYGNWWHATTMVGAAGPVAARKMGLFPAGFDKDGIMYCEMSYSDYPCRVPEGKAAPEDLFPGWMLLSYKKPVTASSSLPDHPTAYLTDESCRTYWAASRRKPGESLVMDLEKEMDVRAVQLNFTDHDLATLMSIPYNHYQVLPEEEKLVRHRWLLEGSTDGLAWETLCDKREAQSDNTHDLLVWEDGITLRYLRLTSYECPFFGNFAMTGLRVFGNAGGQAPQAPAGFRAERDAQDPCTASFSWREAPGADGYNIRFGIAKDKLYHSLMVYGETEATIHSLNAGVPYFARIEAFNGSGITQAECVQVK